jgi:hypothetical protein
MKKLYYSILFALVASLVIVFRRKLEHLTLEEVDTRVTELEDEYKQLQTKIDTQETRMASASVQADQARMLLDSSD